MPKMLSYMFWSRIFLSSVEKLLWTRFYDLLNGESVVDVWALFLFMPNRLSNYLGFQENRDIVYVMFDILKCVFTLQSHPPGEAVCHMAEKRGKPQDKWSLPSSSHMRFCQPSQSSQQPYEPLIPQQPHKYGHMEVSFYHICVLLRIHQYVSYNIIYYNTVFQHKYWCK